MTVFLLIALWVRFEWSYDKFHTEGDRIHRVILGYQEGVGIDEAVAPVPLAPALDEEYTEFEAATRFQEIRQAFRVGDRAIRDYGALVDPDFLTMFSFPLSEGETLTALNDPHSLILTESFAGRLFGAEEPLGRTVLVGDTMVYTVTAIIADPPPNSHLQFEFLLPFEFITKFGRNLEEWGDISFNTYVLLDSRCSVSEANARIAECIARHNPEERDFFYLQPLKEIYLYSNYKFDFDRLGSITHVRLLGAVALITLLISCFNYMGLTTARYSKRAAEVGVRKAVGANRPELVRQFLVESMLTAGIALALAIGLTEMLIPWMNSMSGATIEFGFVEQPMLLVAVLSVFLLTGVFSGLYPALYLSRFRPAKVLGRKYTYGPSGAILRRLLVGAQFAMSIVLISATMVVMRQLEFASSKDLGFDRNYLQSIPLRRAQREKAPALKERLLQIPGVEGATVTSSLPTRVGAGTSGADWEGRAEDQFIQMQILGCDYDLASTFGMGMVAGRFFSSQHPSDAVNGYILNEAAIRSMGIDNPVGKRFAIMGTEGTIVGVVRDFHYASLHSPIEPLIMAFVPVWSRYLCLRVAPQSGSETQAAIGEVWAEFFPDDPLPMSFIDEEIGQLYASEQLVRKLLSIFAGLAIMVACLGLFGLSALVIERRTKEIGIRKVLGASMPGLIQNLSREFVLLVAAASLVAWPLAYYAMNRWLEDFVYRVDLTPTVFLVGGALALGVAAITIGWQAFRAVRANPVEALRYE
jgi:hypothetical protein